MLTVQLYLRMRTGKFLNDEFSNFDGTEKLMIFRAKLN